MAERQDIPINEVLPNQQEKDAMSKTSAVKKKEEAKDTDSSNTVTKESEIHSDNVQIERAEALSEKAEIAVEKMQEAKHTDTSEMVTEESRSQEAEAVSEQAEIAVEKMQEAKVNEDRETQEAVDVSEIAKLEKGSPIVDIKKETVLEIELGTSDLITEPDSNLVSIVPESNVLSNVNRVVSCHTNIRKEDVNDSENECAPPRSFSPNLLSLLNLWRGIHSMTQAWENLYNNLYSAEKDIFQKQQKQQKVTVLTHNILSS